MLSSFDFQHARCEKGLDRLCSLLTGNHEFTEVSLSMPSLNHRVFIYGFHNAFFGTQQEPAIVKRVLRTINDYQSSNGIQKVTVTAKVVDPDLLKNGGISRVKDFLDTDLINCLENEDQFRKKLFTAHYPPRTDITSPSLPKEVTLGFILLKGYKTKRRLFSLDKIVDMMPDATQFDFCHPDAWGLKFLSFQSKSSNLAFQQSKCQRMTIHVQTISEASEIEFNLPDEKAFPYLEKLAFLDDSSGSKSSLHKETTDRFLQQFVGKLSALKHFTISAKPGETTPTGFHTPARNIRNGMLSGLASTLSSSSLLLEIPIQQLSIGKVDIAKHSGLASLLAAPILQRQLR